MIHESTKAQPSASAVHALVMLLRLNGIAVEPQQLLHRYGQHIGFTEMLRCAKELGLKARVIESHWNRLAKTSLPAIAEQADGNFIIVAKIGEGNLLVHDFLAGGPQ